MKITLIGLGNLKGDLTKRAETVLKSARKIIARTAKTPSFANLDGFGAETLDSVFETCRNFDTLNKKLASSVLNTAKRATSATASTARSARTKLAELYLKNTKTPKL